MDTYNPIHLFEENDNIRLIYDRYYRIHLFEENDSIRLIFDRYNLINALIELYEKMEVSIKSITTDYNVSGPEKELITSFLCDTTLKTTNIPDTRLKIDSIILGVQQLYKLKHQLVSNNCTLTNTKSTPNIDNKIDEFRSKIFNPYTSDDHLQKNIEPSCVEKEFTFVIDEVKRAMRQNTEHQSVGIIYNTIYECVLVCDVTENLKRIVDEFPEFVKIRFYDNLTTFSIDMISSYFNKNKYCDIDTLKKKIDAFENLYDITRNPVEDEKNLILYYIKENYTISKNVDKRIKVSVLLDEVEKELRLQSNNNLKYRFASMLAELGLQKKRYSDGMYIYGIESNTISKVKGDLETKLTNQEIDHFIASRDKDIKIPISV